MKTISLMDRPGELYVSSTYLVIPPPHFADREESETPHHGDGLQNMEGNEMIQRAASRCRSDAALAHAKTHKTSPEPIGLRKHPYPPSISSQHHQRPHESMDVYLQPDHPSRPAVVEHGRAVIDGGEEEWKREGPAGCENDERKLTDAQQGASVPDIPQHLVADSMLAVVADEDAPYQVLIVRPADLV